LDFSTIFNRFYKFQPYHTRRIESLCNRVPRNFKLFTTIPSVPRHGPKAAAYSPAARWSTGWKTSDGGKRLGSPVIDWWRWIDRGGRRRAAAVTQGRHGHGNSNGGEDRGSTQQCAAPGASMWPREDARQVTGRGGSAEGRARGRRSSGGRGNSGSGNRAVRLDQQAARGATGVQKEVFGSLWG
jgi:hypothetical protein